MAKDGRENNEEVAAQLDKGRYLHDASGKGHDLIVSLLLKHGADPNIIDAGGNRVTPLILAAKEGHAGVAVALLSDARVNIGLREEGGHSALDLAAIEEHTDVISAIVRQHPEVINSASNETGFSALHHAAVHNVVRSIDALVSAGADLENRDGEGYTPLRVAASSDSKAALLSLLGHGADKESMGLDGQTPLLGAMENEFWGIASELMTAGADVNLRGVWHEHSPNELSPLDYAVDRGDIDLTRQLLQLGARATDSTSDGCTALHWAAWSMNASAIDLLVEAGANLETRTTYDGSTPLHLAASQGANAAAIEALVRHGADVHAQEKPSGKTPLHVAAQNASIEHSWETVDALLKAGADETRLDCQGQTPLDFLEATIDASDDNYPEAVEHTRSLLVNAPKDRAQRAWSRRSFFVLCRAHPDRVRLTDVVDDGATAPRAKKMATAAVVDSGRRGNDCESADNFQRAMGSWMRLKEDGIFREIMAFL